jgi:hypothetical protein
MLLKIRATVPLLAVIAYFIVRLPTQADAHPAEIAAAFVVIPALIAWGVTGLERVILEAQSAMERAIVEELDDGPATEPMLMTHEFHPMHERHDDAADALAYAMFAYQRSYPRLGGKHERTEVIPAVSE